MGLTSKLVCTYMHQNGKLKESQNVTAAFSTNEIQNREDESRFRTAQNSEQAQLEYVSIPLRK